MALLLIIGKLLVWSYYDEFAVNFVLFINLLGMYSLFLKTFLLLFSGISRDSWHKRRHTGGRKKALTKKRKHCLGRPAANTKVRKWFLVNTATPCFQIHVIGNSVLRERAALHRHKEVAAQEELDVYKHCFIV